MFSYIIRRILLIIPTLFLVTVLVFLAVRLLPGDVIELMLSEHQEYTQSEYKLTIEGLKKKMGMDVPIYLHPEDEFLYNSLPKQGAWFGMEYSPAPPLENYLQPDEELLVGDLTIKVHHTPGHSPGSVTLEVGEHLFCGDLIFAGSVGRTDLPGGSWEEMMESIRSKILTLPDDTLVLPGHGPHTTVAQERSTNPFIR